MPLYFCLSGGSKLEDVGTCCPVGGLNHFLEVYDETENSASVRFFPTKVMSNVATFYKTISHFSIIYFFFFHVLLIKRPVSHRLRKKPSVFCPVFGIPNTIHATLNRQEIRDFRTEVKKKLSFFHILFQKQSSFSLLFSFPLLFDRG